MKSLKITTIFHRDFTCLSGGSQLVSGRRGQLWREAQLCFMNLQVVVTSGCLLLKPASGNFT